MESFVAVNFETANPRRESACALGYAIVNNRRIIATGHHLIKPVGGHTPYQARNHGITAADTRGQPDFGALVDKFSPLFKKPLAGSPFDRQVLLALCGHYDMGLWVDYTDVCALARRRLPGLSRYTIATIARYLGLTCLKSTHIETNAVASAEILLALAGAAPDSPLSPQPDRTVHFETLIHGILPDDAFNYKDAYALLYWMEDHPELVREHPTLYQTTRLALAHKGLGRRETGGLRKILLNGV